MIVEFSSFQLILEGNIPNSRCTHSKSPRPHISIDFRDRK